MIIPEAGIAHPRVVIRTTHTFIADLTIGSYAGSHVSLPIVMEGLFKLLGCSTHIPEMDEENLPLSSEMANDIGQIVGHQGEITLTESNPIHRTWDKIDELLVILHTAHDPSNPPDR